MIANRWICTGQMECSHDSQTGTQWIWQSGLLFPKTLGVIPARGGSKRLPRKNLRPLNGKPLVQYTIEAAEQSRLTKFVVSTEDYQIGALCGDLGAYVVRRPEELASDDASSDVVALHALEWMGSDGVDILVVLHPTSPCRTGRHIDEAVLNLLFSEANSLASVDYRKRCYRHNAAIYAVKVPWFLEHKKLYDDHTIPFLMDKRSSLDIDDEDDWKIAELYLNAPTQ